MCHFGLSHDAYRRNIVVVNEPNTPGNQKRLTIKTPNGKTRRIASVVAPSEALGSDSPGPAAPYKSPSALKDRLLRIGRRDYPQASFLYGLESAQKNVPPPASYTAKHTLTDASRYDGTGFGYGMRDNPILVLSQNLNDPKQVPMYVSVPESNIRCNPGPG